MSLSMWSLSVFFLPECKGLESVLSLSLSGPSTGTGPDIQVVPNKCSVHSLIGYSVLFCVWYISLEYLGERWGLEEHWIWIQFFSFLDKEPEDERRQVMWSGRHGRLVAEMAGPRSQKRPDNGADAAGASGEEERTVSGLASQRGWGRYDKGHPFLGVPCPRANLLLSKLQGVGGEAACMPLGAGVGHHRIDLKWRICDWSNLGMPRPYHPQTDLGVHLESALHLGIRDKTREREISLGCILFFWTFYKNQVATFL